MRIIDTWKYISYTFLLGRRPPPDHDMQIVWTHAIYTDTKYKRFLFRAYLFFPLCLQFECVFEWAYILCAADASYFFSGKELKEFVDFLYGMCGFYLGSRSVCVILNARLVEYIVLPITQFYNCTCCGELH